MLKHNGLALKGKRDSLDCEWGKDISFDLNRLKKFCWDELTEDDYDLLVILATVVFADRRVKRKVETNGIRQFFLRIPIYNETSWNNEKVKNSLERCLNFLTGDYWKLQFIKRSYLFQDFYNSQINFLGPYEKAPIVFSYSGGLDSFAGLNLFLSDNPKSPVILFTAEHNSANKTDLFATTKLLRHKKEEPEQKVTVPIHFKSKKKALESTYRTRTFLFFVLAALTCKLARGSKVIITENGQSTIGPSFVIYGDEHPFRATHPGFTTRLKSFLNALWYPKKIDFDHPHIWQTKGEVLRDLKNINKNDNWSSTHTCSRENTLPRRRKITGRPPCGICSGCLLRRMSLFNAGYINKRDKEEYLWNDLNQIELKDAVDRVKYPQMTTNKNDLDIAIFSVLDFKNLAKWSKISEEHPTFERISYEISENLGISKKETDAKISRLLNQHTQEWQRFLDSWKPDSWIRQIAER